ncbi:hypothetical protein AAFF_G00187270 [Aldrovandia affinis]|uniref:Uncharacterized protein n=1 Tax=Aldrovandia affinis TaxID=143900 RepID=A0AAD7SY27_9TELE|nr:hypothetical protein AAFF_G00187270 [Aldrovandia affinis]
MLHQRRRDDSCPGTSRTEVEADSCGAASGMCSRVWAGVVGVLHRSVHFLFQHARHQPGRGPRTKVRGSNMTSVVPPSELLISNQHGFSGFPNQAGVGKKATDRKADS